MPGSGKSEAVRIARDLDIPVVRMGDFVLEEVRRRGLPVEEDAIGPVATGMRAEHGDDVWAKRTVEAIRAGEVEGIDPDDPVLVVDGVRSLAEIERFRAELGHDFTLVAVTAPDAVRHARILGRGRADDAADRARVEKRDARERGWGIEEAIGSAEIAVANDGDLESFRGHASEVLLGILETEKRH